jgi:hypothetical protein
MKLEQFIEKHSLSRMQFPSGRVEAMFSMPDEDAKRSRDDRYELYANAGKTIWVSLNQTHRRFRICFCEMVVLCSEWLNADLNFLIDPIEAEPLHDA